MGPPSHMRCVVDRNVDMRPIPVITQRCPNVVSKSLVAISKSLGARSGGGDISKLHSEDPVILGATVSNFVATVS
jgi:hypothetical protein